MGDGTLTRITEAELKRDIEEGTQDAAERSGGTYANVPRDENS